jgi:Tfp pilus assembly protein PilN
VKPVNLLPDQHRRGPRPGATKGSAYVVVGVLAVALVMLLTFTVTANQANSRKSDAAAAKQEADQLEAKAQALGSYGNFSQIKAARTATVKQLAASRFDFERMLRELAAVLPAGGWLKEANASVTGETGSETASSASTSAGGATVGQPALSLIGCAPRQRDVADFMVRLRELYLVSEVELAESKRGESATPPTPDNCGSYLEFSITVTFSSSAPTGDESPPGHRGVPARLGGGS